MTTGTFLDVLDDEADPIAAAMMAAPPGRNLPNLDPVLTRPAWQADALCREHPEVDFFADNGAASDPARAVCGRCLVRDECHAYAVELDLDGVWGGLDARDRRRLTADDPAA